MNLKRLPFKINPSFVEWGCLKIAQSGHTLSRYNEGKNLSTASALTKMKRLHNFHFHPPPISISQVIVPVVLKRFVKHEMRKVKTDDEYFQIVTLNHFKNEPLPDSFLLIFVLLTFQFKCQIHKLNFKHCKIA